MPGRHPPGRAAAAETRPPYSPSSLFPSCFPLSPSHSPYLPTISLTPIPPIIPPFLVTLRCCIGQGTGEGEAREVIRLLEDIGRDCLIAGECLIYAGKGEWCGEEGDGDGQNARNRPFPLICSRFLSFSLVFSCFCLFARWAIPQRTLICH